MAWVRRGGHVRLLKSGQALRPWRVPVWARWSEQYAGVSIRSIRARIIFDDILSPSYLWVLVGMDIDVLAHDERGEKKPGQWLVWPMVERRISLPYQGSPEEAVLSVLKSEGWYGEHTEGNLTRSLFRALLLPYLIDNNPYKTVDPLRTPLLHAIHFLVPMTAQGLIGILAGGRAVPELPISEMHDVIDSRLQCLDEVLSDYLQVCEACATVWPKSASGKSMARLFLEAYDQEFWHKLLDVYARYDGSMASGWPDLELSNGREVVMVEVKVRDRLTANQKVTIPQLIGMGVGCRLIRLV